MKECSWYLLLNGKKVHNIRDLRDNFDTDVLVGYYLGGSLEQWLNETDEQLVLKRIENIDKTQEIGAQLEFAFGVIPDKKRLPDKAYTVPAVTVSYNELGISSFNSSFSAFSVLNIFPSSGYSLSGGSFSIFTTSFRNFSTSYRGFSTSYRGFGGSSGGSFGSFSRYDMFLSEGSFRYSAGGYEITEQEYKRTMINLSSCPLNEYGYGINLV